MLFILMVKYFRSVVLFWAMVDLVIKEMWKGIVQGPGQEWSNSVAEWIRANDETILTRSTKILNTFQEELVPAEGNFHSY